MTKVFKNLTLQFEGSTCTLGTTEFVDNAFDFWQFGPNAPGPGSGAPNTWDGIGDRPEGWVASRDPNGEYEAALVSVIGQDTWDLLKPMYPRPIGEGEE
jgi:hypothetical protein